MASLYPNTGSISRQSFFPKDRRNKILDIIDKRGKLNFQKLHKLEYGEGFLEKNQLIHRIESIIITRSENPIYYLEVIYYAESSPDS